MPPSAPTLLLRRLRDFMRPPRRRGTAVFRRIVFLGAGTALLSATGLSWLVFHWRGDRGRPPAGRLYLIGDFAGSKPLLRLRKAGGARAAREGVCFTLQSRLAAGRAGSVCSGGQERVWLGDARVEVTVSGAGLPAVALVGARYRPGEWIGSGAGGGSSPRFPLRGYGTPSRAAEVVSCPASIRGPAACIRVHDRLGRLAVARWNAAAQREPRLAPGGPLPLYPGDELWLGLVPYTVGVERDGARPVLTLERRSGAPGPPGSLVGRGGDRRWLGRLWPIETPDPSAPATESYDVYPMRERFSPQNLSTRRTNFEIEDRLQRLVDGEWLCLDEEGAEVRIRWRALDTPGCGASRAATATAHTEEEAEDYRLGRYGGGGLIPRLVEAANAGLGEHRYLDAPSGLPLAFDWVLRADPAAGPQPRPATLWGVRFGAVQMGRRGGGATRVPPTVVLRGSTARDRVELLENGVRRATFYLPPRDSGRAGSRPGGVCLATGLPGAGVLLREVDGSHHPLGTAALGGGGAIRWFADSGLPCGGCRLGMEGTGGALRVTPAGCRGTTAPFTLAEGTAHPLEGGWSLRYAPRSSSAWVAMSDPASGRRYFAQEFVAGAGLAPLLGPPGGTQGVEAAVQAMTGTPAGPARPLELTIDGDLQLQAAEIVRRAVADAASSGRPGEGRLSAVVLDARTGEILAATSVRRPARQASGVPTAWDAATGRVGADNDAFLRDRPIGSTMKVVGAYVLANNGFAGPGPPPPGTEVPEAVFRGGGHGIFLARALAAGRPREEPLPRYCSAGGGAHTVPVDDRAFTEDLFVDRFGRSCNAFFIVNGFRYASARAAQVARAPGANVLSLDDRAPPGLVLRPPGDASLASRIRTGLLADAARPDSSAPRSIYGALVRLGFQLDPGMGHEGPAGWLEVEEGGARGRVELARDWFAASGGGPSLHPGDDFRYPALPSPGRLDDAGAAARPMEWYDGNPLRVVRDAGTEGEPNAQYAMLMIGQSSVTASALSVAALYAPAARADGRAVAPCLFRAWCRDPRESPVVLDPSGAGAAVFNRALLRVVEAGTATTVLSREGFGRGGGWGGKSGTFNLDVSVWPAGMGSREEWDAVAAFACGVRGAAPPEDALVARLRGGRPDLADAVLRLRAAAPGAASGAAACERRSRPLNPAGIHRYRAGPWAAALDALDRRVSGLASASKREVTYHAMVLVALPRRGGLPGVPSAAEGIVVAVLEDDELDIAKIIAGRLAAAAERWSAVRR